MSWNYLEPHQSRQGPPSPYEVKLAGAIEEAFGRGSHALPELLAELKADGLVASDGRPFTEASFTTEMHRLGA
ncbi:MAG: hypothetical protein EPN43_12065 [Jatrophihabitans sp.]|nr:MAG: hypothetical protein EPN43_12065 [Jatrophihabitans sp.]